MKRAKICALIGSVFTTLIAVLMMFAFIRFIINWEEKDLEMTLTIAGHSGLFLLKLFALVFVIVMSIMIVNGSPLFGWIDQQVEYGNFIS